MHVGQRFIKTKIEDWRKNYRYLPSWYLLANHVEFNSKIWCKNEVNTMSWLSTGIETRMEIARSCQEIRVWAQSLAIRMRGARNGNEVTELEGKRNHDTISTYLYWLHCSFLSSNQQRHCTKMGQSYTTEGNIHTITIPVNTNNDCIAVARNRLSTKSPYRLTILSTQVHNMTKFTEYHSNLISKADVIHDCTQSVPHFLAVFSFRTVSKYWSASYRSYYSITKQHKHNDANNNSSKSFQSQWLCQSIIL